MAETGIAIGTLVPSVGSIIPVAGLCHSELLGIALDKVQLPAAAEGEYRLRQLFTDKFARPYPPQHHVIQTSDGERSRQ